MSATKKPNPADAIRVVLSTHEFCELVAGRPIRFVGGSAVEILLADIGFDVMQRALDDARGINRVPVPIEDPRA